ncbi:hypothetical protein BKA82DRAFT_2972802 [Pisolithus tinctorius]|nr:hypothetical protein BKA82DRAFT_2972802 [Pisolithus tinctorius]
MEKDLSVRPIHLLLHHASFHTHGFFSSISIFHPSPIPSRCARHPMYFALEVGKVADVPGDRGSRCGACLCFVVLTILPSPFPFVVPYTNSRNPPLSSCTIPLRYHNKLYEWTDWKKVCLHVRSVFFSRPITLPTSPICFSLLFHFEIVSYVQMDANEVKVGVNILFVGLCMCT